MNKKTFLTTEADPGPLAFRRMEFENRRSEDGISFYHLQRHRSKYIPHDSRLSSFIHEKTRLLFRFQICVAASIIMSSFFSSYYEFDQFSDKLGGMILSINVSFLTFLFTGLRWIEIWLDTVKKKIDVNVESGLKPTQSYYLRWILSVFFLIHPNILTYRLQITTEYAFSRSYQHSSFKRNFNDYLFIFQLTLIMGKILINILRLSRFSKPRIHRLSRICGFSCTRSFVFKCHLLKDTLITLASIICLLGFYFSLVFCVTEAPVAMLEKRSDEFFSEPFNFLEAWYFVSGTFLLYGTGDIVVGSHLGAFFASFCCYIGAFNVPFIAVAIERKIKMSQAQEKAFKVEHYQKLLLEKKSLQEQIKKFVKTHEDVLTVLDSDQLSVDFKLEALPSSYQQQIHAFRSKYHRLDHKIDKAAEPSEEDIPDHMTHMLILFNRTMNELKNQLESQFTED